jgi:hypothetical protein
MNLAQIAQGNYRSLLGTWVSTAYGATCFCNKPIQWHPGNPTFKPSVTASKMVNGDIVVQGKSVSDGQNLKNVAPVFKSNGKYLTAELADTFVAINYAIYFYPRGVANPSGWTLNNGVKIPSSTNRIVIWSSDDQLTEVFSQK